MSTQVCKNFKPLTESIKLLIKNDSFETAKMKKQKEEPPLLHLGRDGKTKLKNLLCQIGLKKIITLLGWNSRGWLAPPLNESAEE